MPSDELREVLKVLGVAVTNPDDAIERRTTLGKIARWDREIDERRRETIDVAGRLRSRRIA